MGIGDVYAVEEVSDCYYVDTGMYDVPGYGSVYIYDTDRPAIVDSGIGTNYEYVLEGLKEVGIDPPELESILITHVHLDHAGGAGFLSAETGADVYVYEGGASFLADPERIWEGTKAAVGDQIEYYTEPKPVSEDRLVPIDEGSTIDIGDRTLDVYHAPGHAFHQVVFHDTEANAVFSADAAGIYARDADRICETSPPPGFDLEEVIEDARTLQALDPDTICYAHFGPAPADSRLEEYIDVITEWIDAVEEYHDEFDDEEAIVERFLETSDATEIWGERKGAAEIRLNVSGAVRYLEQRSAD